MLLLCSVFRLKEVFKVKNALTTQLLFFMTKIWVGRTTLKGEIKGDGLPGQIEPVLHKVCRRCRSYFDTL